MPIVLDNLNLSDAERKLCEEALVAGGSIVEAANLLGITRHALKRRIVKHQIEWPKPRVASLQPQRTDSPLSQRSAISAF
jgi:hypothetical protein